MPGWEYKVVPAPTKGLKGKGIKGAEARFAFALETLMNEMGAEGWEFQRAETLPSIERSGLTGSATEWRNLMVFRKPVTAVQDEFEPELLPPPADVPEIADTVGGMNNGTEDTDNTTKSDSVPLSASNAAREDNALPDITASLKLRAQHDTVDAKD